MTRSDQSCEQGFTIKFHSPDSLNLLGEGAKLIWQDEEALVPKCHLIFHLNFEQYEQINLETFFNSEFNIGSNVPIFQPDYPIELNISLKPDLLPDLSDQVDDLEKYLTQLNTECPSHPLFLADNWFLLHVKQTTPSGDIIHRTFWDYLNPANLTADNVDNDQVAEAISNFFQDWFENNVADLTTDAIETAFQELAQDLTTWADENFTDLDAEELTQLLEELGTSLENLANSDELSDITFSKPKLFDTVLRFFTEDDWAYTKIQGEPTLRLAFQGKNGNWSCYVQVYEENQKLAFYSLCPTNTPENKRPAIAEFITRANYGLILGNFELDYTDGEIRYKTSIDVEGDHLTPVLVKNLVYTNVIIMDQYLPGIIGIIEGNSSPVDAIAQIEA